MDPDRRNSWLSYSYRDTTKSLGSISKQQISKDTKQQTDIKEQNTKPSSTTSTTDVNSQKQQQQNIQSSRQSLKTTSDLLKSKEKYKEKQLLDENTLNKLKEKRNENLKELLETEKLYVENLKTIIEIFITPIRNGEILSKMEFSSLFSNVEFIYEQVNLPLLNQLEIAMKEQQDCISIAKVFLELGDLFKLYAVYCSNQPNIHSRIIQLKDESQEFKVILRKAFRNPRCRKLDLESFLICPLQRLCKYPMLLKVKKKKMRDQYIFIKLLK